MVTRLLRADEWPRLATTGVDYATWSKLDPASAEIVIVEDESGRIVATWGTFAVRHVEGFWVHPDHQKRGAVLRRLFLGMRNVLQRFGMTHVVTGAQTTEVADLLQSAGATRLPGESFLLPVDFGPWAKG